MSAETIPPEKEKLLTSRQVMDSIVKLLSDNKIRGTAVFTDQQGGNWNLQSSVTLSEEIGMLAIRQEELKLQIQANIMQGKVKPSPIHRV